MMHERIALNGAPVVGFGGDPYEMALAQERAAAPATIVGFFVGAITGAVLGNVIHKGAVGTAVGTVVGAVGGGIGGNLLGASFKSSSVGYLRASWRRIQPADMIKLKAGQKLAVAIAEPNGVPIPPEVVAQINVQFTALATAPVNLPTRNFVQYPPGSKLPDDWPGDDDLGPNAYRIMADVVADAPLEAAGLKPPRAEIGTMEIWVRP